MRTVKELISSGKYRKELDPILNSFLKHQLKHKGFLKEDYSIYDLKKYYDEVYSNTSCSITDVTAVWNYEKLVEEGVI